MPVTIISHDPKSDASAFEGLKEAIADNRQGLLQITLEASRVGVRGQGGRYAETGLCAQIIEPDDGMPADTDQQIAEDIWGAAENYDADTGEVHRFRARIECEDDEGKIRVAETATFQVNQPPGGDGGVGSLTPVGGEALALAAHQNRVIKDLDRIVLRQHTAMGQMAEQMAKMAGPIAKAQVEIEQIRHRRYERDLEHAERMDFQKGGFEFLSKLAEPLGVQLGQVARDFAARTRGETSSAGAPDPTVLCDRFRAVMEHLSEGKRAQLEAELGEDLSALSKAMAEAKTDVVFRNVAQKFSQTWKASKDPMGLLKRIGEILGESDAQEFGDILQAAVVG